MMSNEGGLLIRLDKACQSTTCRAYGGGSHYHAIGNPDVVAYIRLWRTTTAESMCTMFFIDGSLTARIRERIPLGERP